MSSKLLGLIGGAVLTVSSLTSCHLFDNNFRVVDPERVYGSAALDEKEVEEAQRDLGIRFYVDLRTYGSEKRLKTQEACERLGINYFNPRISARRLPREHEIIELEKTFRTIEELGLYPGIIACDAGADRTAAAIVLYKMFIRNCSATEASEHFSIRHGHLPSELDEFPTMYEKRLTYTKASAH